VARYGTAAQTVREAIKVLKAEGLAVGRRGRGVYVRERPPLLLRLEATRRFVSQAKAAGRHGEARLLEVEAVPAPIEVAERLDISPDSQVPVRVYLLLLDGDPVQVSHSYFPPEFAEGSVISDKADINPADIDADLEARFGARADSFIDELSIRMPTPDEIRSLRLLPGTPIGVLWRTYHDRAGRTVEVVRFVLAGDKQTLVYSGRLRAGKAKRR
jgi:GntR family transcriptional regulator